MRMIDADDFGNRMYHEAFEKDSDLQKWDSGCWIRYKLFENVLREQPTIQPVANDTNVGDTISRQWLMECVNEGWIKFDTEKDKNRFIHLVRDIAPSAQPTATWLIRKWGDDAQCSNCGKTFKDVYDMDNYDQYCRHCGTQMKGIKAI